MALSNTQKQQAFRARKAALGHFEVRGIYAPAEAHAKIKWYARRLTPKPGKPA